MVTWQKISLLTHQGSAERIYGVKITHSQSKGMNMNAACKAPSGTWKVNAY